MKKCKPFQIQKCKLFASKGFLTEKVLKVKINIINNKM